MNNSNALQTSALGSFESFGKYLFLKRLAAGGMAEVFLARPASQEGNGRVLVIKRILPHVASNREFRQMFQTEIQVIMGFNHPHTVQLHDFGHFNQQPYIAMEYIEGKNLKELMNQLSLSKVKMPIPAALGIIMQAASGLNYAHNFVNKVTGDIVHAVHRDISPHNLLLSYEGNLKVIDFGIAKAATSISETTQVGTLKGKIAYLSPEQIDNRPVDARSDVFSLGIVAWELLTLSRPFSSNNESEVTIIGKIRDCDRTIRAPSEINPEIPPELDQVILKALRSNPDERFASAIEFQKALREVMIRFYPNHSYAETSQLLHTLFEQEIIKDRQEIQNLNRQAQLDLTPTDGAKTVVNFSEGTHGAGINSPDLHLVHKNSEINQVDVRLSQIESMMKQKAQRKHYLLFAFYIVSLFAIKMDDSFKLLYNSLTSSIASEKNEGEVDPVIKTKPSRSNQNQQNTKSRKKSAG